MSDVDTQTEDLAVERMALLKQRARLMGITFSNNISADKLQEKIAAKMEGVELVEEPKEEVNPLVGDTKPQDKELTVRERLMRDELKLVRLRITNMDPKKKDLPGEIFTVGNETLGMIRKYIPYGETTADGYHVPYIIYRELEDRKFHNIRTVKGSNGQTKVLTGWVKEFSLEVLPPLTEEELRRLANAQAAAGVFGQD